MQQNLDSLSFRDTLLLGCYNFGLGKSLYTTEIFLLLGYYAALIHSYIPTFQGNLLITFSKGTHLFLGQNTYLNFLLHDYV